MPSNNRNRVLLHKKDDLKRINQNSLIEIQTNSFKYFLQEGVKEEFENIAKIVAYGGKFELEFLPGYHFGEPENSFEDCKIQEITYSAPLRIPVRLTNRESGEVVEQEVFEWLETRQQK